MTPIDEQAAQEFIDLYGASAWADWRRLLAHFDWGEGFAFLLLLLPGAMGAEICRRNLIQHLARKSKRLEELPCAWRDDVRRLPDRLFALSVAEDSGGIWVGSVIPESDPEIQSWQEAWRTALASLNQHRNPLKERFACPLVLVGAPWLNTVLRDAAPDLWSIRTGVVLVSPSNDREIDSDTGRDTNSEVSRQGEAARATSESQFSLVGEAAADPDYTLEQADRLRGRSGLEAERARLLFRAGNGFAEHFRWDSAERCFRAASDVLAPLAAQDAGLQSLLAAVLNDLAKVLSAMGRRQEALSAVEDSLRIYRELAAARPEALLPDLARSLNNLGYSLRGLGRHDEARSAAEESLRLYRELAASRAGAFRPDLASSLSNLAIMQGELGRREEALSAAEESLRLYRQLAAARPAAFRQDLARSLNNLANGLGALGRREEALSAAEESLRIYRELAAARPDALLPSLAVSLNNLAIRLDVLGRHEEALSAANEALKICRELAASRPDAFQPDLARSCGTLAVVFAAMARHQEAAESAAEGIRLLARWFRQLPQAFAALIGSLCRTYLQETERAGDRPDRALLAPIAEVLQNSALEAGAQSPHDASELTSLANQIRRALGNKT